VIALIVRATSELEMSFAISFVILPIAMFAVSILFSMLGQGGGALYTPLQVYSGIPIHTAAATSLFLIMVTSLSATVVFRKAKKVDWPLAIVLEIVTGLGGFLGGLYSRNFSNSALSIFFAIVLFVAAFFMIRKMESKAYDPSTPHDLFHWRREFDGNSFLVNLPLALPSAFLAGSASGLVGVGGGIINVPLMVVLLGIPVDVAVGCSAFMVGVTATCGLAGHLIDTHWDWKLALLLAVAVYLGGRIGARTSMSVDKEKLRSGFGWFLILIAVTIIWKALH